MSEYMVSSVAEYYDYDNENALARIKQVDEEEKRTRVYSLEEFAKTAFGCSWKELQPREIERRFVIDFNGKYNDLPYTDKYKLKRVIRASRNGVVSLAGLGPITPDDATML